MFPHSFLGILIGITVIIGIGTLVNHLSRHVFNIDKSSHVVSWFALLVLVGVFYPIGTLVSVVIGIYFLIRGNAPEKIATIAFFITAFVMFLLSHAFLIFHL